MNFDAMEWLKLGGSALVAVAGGAWALFKWSHGHQEKKAGEERDAKQRNRLYMAPFLSAAQALQSRLYNILELNGLKSLREGGAPYPEETLYLIAKYFGWESRVTEHGILDEDTEALALMESIRQTFATDGLYAGGAFCIFRNDQKDFGQQVVIPTTGAPEAGYETAHRSDFMKLAQSPPLSNFRFLKTALDALRKARDASDLEGWERLQTIQGLLVKLLEHCEEREGFSVSSGKRLIAGSGRKTT